MAVALLFEAPLQPVNDHEDCNVGFVLDGNCTPGSLGGSRRSSGSKHGECGEKTEWGDSSSASRFFGAVVHAHF